MSKPSPPAPIGRQAVEGILPKWRDFVRKIRPGRCDTVKDGDISSIQKLILKAARGIGITVTTRKLDGGGLRVWRIK